MTTTVTKTIGTAGGRDYSNCQSWFDAIPTNITASGTDQVHIGLLYNDSEFTSSSTYTFSGKTTDSTHTITLKPAVGQGFNTHPSKLTNKLRFDPANGVSIAFDVGGTSWVISQANFFMEGVQVSNFNYYTQNVIYASAGSYNAFIVTGYSTRYSDPPLYIAGTAVATNPLVITGNNRAGIGVDSSTNVPAFLTVISVDQPSSYNRYPVNGGYNTVLVQNAASFGFSPNVGSVTGFPDAATDYNGSDFASALGTHDKYGLTPSNELQYFPNDGNQDFRLKSTSALVAAGKPVSGVTTDILGQTRNSTNPCIGCYEYAPTGTPVRAYYRNGVRLTRVATGQIGTGLKPIVRVGVGIKERATSEGLPQVKSTTSTSLRDLASGEVIEI